MGPSGAGKSSLLNVLAGRSAPAPGISIEGKVCVGGKLINPVAFRKNIAYVMQDDALLATATPREAILFSATMRLPGHYSKEKINNLVDEMIDLLGLKVCADVMIGGALIKGISGGQRKRTSVAVELITEPRLLFLDEPTSGLDSFTAFTLVSLLKTVAKKCTILCTIHQPSSEVFFLFDVVIFVKDGRIFYQGPVKGIIDHFDKFNFHCPSNYNPSDFVMSLSQVIPRQEAEDLNMFMPCPDSLVDNQESMKLLSEVVFTVESSFAKQIGALSYREAVNTYRDTAALIGRFGVTIFLNFLFGLIFLNAGGKNDSDATNFNSHFGAITMILISCMFGSAQPVMLSFPYERPMFLREYSTEHVSTLPFIIFWSPTNFFIFSSLDGVIAYFVSKMCVEVFLSFAQTLCQFILVYFMVNMNGSFIYIVLAAWGLAMASSSVAVMLGCSVSNVKSVTELAPLLFVPQMLFVGFFIKTSQIPIFLRWAQYLCSLKYAMNLIILTEFNEHNHSCSRSDAAAENCHNLITSNNIVQDQYWVYIILLIALIIAFRLVGGFILVEKAKRFY